MLLYFDNYITNEPLHKNSYPGLDEIRSTNTAYRAQDKLHIAMYTLASYAAIRWSTVVIKYELADASKNDYFEEFIYGLFPKAIIIRGRSDNQKKFKESFELLKQLGDEWIFYAGNTDHPFVAPEMKTLEKCLEKAKALRKKNKFVSVYYSHFPEAINLPRKGTPLNIVTKNSWKMVEEDENCVVATVANGNFDSIQILHIDHFEHLFCKPNLGSERIIRVESVSKKVEVKDQLLVIPKREICAHYDGYSHIEDFYGLPTPYVILPPLFIPPGFFEKSIRIAYGYSELRDGWVNINPLKSEYSFRDEKNGTDLKLGLEDLPLFWKDWTKTVDINPARDKAAIAQARKKNLELLRSPWKKRNVAYYLSLKAKRGLRLVNYFRKNPEHLKESLNAKDKTTVSKLMLNILAKMIDSEVKIRAFKRKHLGD